MKDCLYSLPPPSVIFQPNQLLYSREGAQHGKEQLSSAVTSHGQLCCHFRNVKGRQLTEVFETLEKLQLPGLKQSSPKKTPKPNKKPHKQPKKA